MDKKRIKRLLKIYNMIDELNINESETIRSNYLNIFGHHIEFERIIFDFDLDMFYYEAIQDIKKTIKEILIIAKINIKEEKIKKEEPKEKKVKINDTDFKRIEGFPNYIISPSGIIYSMKNNSKRKLISPWTNKATNIKYVKIRGDTGRKTFRIPVLVMKTFGNYYGGKIIHLDGNSENNNIENLQEF